jgi:TolA-binding protein
MTAMPWIWLGGLLLVSAPALAAAESLAREVADREVAEERFRILRSSVDDLMAAQMNLQRRLDVLEQSIVRLSAEVRSKPGEDRVVSRREFEELGRAIQEVDRKREADRRQILDQIEELGRSLTAALRESRPTPPVRVSPPESRAGPATPQEGAEHIVQAGQTLSAIIVAYNAEWKARGRRTSLQLILDANPGLEPKTMAVGRKVFIPMVPIDR